MTRDQAIQQVLAIYTHYNQQEAEYQLSKVEQNMDGDSYDYQEILKDHFAI